MSEDQKSEVAIFTDILRRLVIVEAYRAINEAIELSRYPHMKDSCIAEINVFSEIIATTTKELN